VTTSTTGSKIGKSADETKLPKIFYVNWFRRDADGGFLWPGFGENSRVLKWVIERIEGRADAAETPIGYVPTPESLDTDGLDMTPEQIQAALNVSTEEWAAEVTPDPGVVRQVRRHPAGDTADRARQPQGPPRPEVSKALNERPGPFRGPGRSLFVRSHNPRFVDHPVAQSPGLWTTQSHKP